MDNSLKLIPGKKYKVVKPFTDYDHILHPVDEIWVYEGTNFFPYEDGLVLYVRKNMKRVTYRLQWRKEAQEEIIENFRDYVKQY